MAAPEVDGEERADHPRPSWLWTVPDGASGFRVRIDGAAWSVLERETTWLTSPEELEDGVHLFEVAARDRDGLYGPAAAFTTEVARVAREGDAFWRQNRLMATSPLGHPCAVSPGNAYVDDGATVADNLAATLAAVQAAQTAGADLIELDLVHVDGQVLIDGDDDGAGERAAFADLLSDRSLRDGDQALFLELAETEPDEEFVRRVLDTLAEHRAAYALAGRHVFLRAHHDHRASLDHARELLDSPEYLLLRPYVRLGVIFGRDQVTRALVVEAASRGEAVVDLEYRTPELITLASLARSLGLGVAVHGVPAASGEVLIAGLRESVDAVTVEGPVDLARSVVERANAQFYLDASGQDDEATRSITYRGTDAVSRVLAVNGDAQPLLRVGQVDDPVPGGQLSFDAAASRAGPLDDADAPPGQGVLVALSVRLATSELPDGDFMTILAKSDHSGWSLDLENPEGEEVTVLRFSVYVAGAYHRATFPAANLSTSRAHLITCAYAGEGRVGMWIDNDATGVTASDATGGIENNDHPVLLGADPGSQYRYFFDGDIQMALGQAWGPP